MRILLLPISFLYHIVLAIRHKLYDWRILKTTQFEHAVICVGNLNLGGTGKTPHTEYLIRLLKGDFHVATLSRGYGRKNKGFKRAETTSTCEDLGDEPMQYFRKFKDIQVAVGEDRVNGVRKLLMSHNAPDVVLLDDAFQHRSIKAGLNILLTEYKHLYTEDHLIPAGTLRDIRSSSKRADIIVVSKAPKDLDEASKTNIVTRLKPHKHQRVFFSYLDYAPLQPLNEKAGTVAAEDADSVLAICGIANPTPFFEALEKHYKTVVPLPFADHHVYTKEDVEEIMKRYENLGAGKKIIVTTEKDAARLTNSPYFCQFECAPLYDWPIMVRFHEEEKFNEEILNYVRQNLHHC